MLPKFLTEGAYRVIPLPRFAQGGKWRTEAMRSYSQPVLIWFTKGQGRITISGNTRGYGAHNAVFLPAGTMHGFDMLGQVHGWVLFFPRAAAADLPSEPVHLRLREAHLQAELTALVESIRRETAEHRPGADKALRHHGGLLAVWLERQMQDEPELSLDASRRIAAAYTALVERDFRSRKTVADYAAALGITPTHLTRACNAACGRSASRILADRIHYEARHLLQETRRPVKEIARELGFSSPAYFTRAFLKNTGLTPSAFRATG